MDGYDALAAVAFLVSTSKGLALTYCGLPLLASFRFD